MSISREQFLNTTQAKSNQINADDLLGGPLVCQITDIQLNGSADQPISIFVDAHPQPWKPAKTTRRVLAACWPDSEPSDWIGRYVVLYNDEKVKWAGEEVGGIRISHMSHISGTKRVSVNATRGKKAVQVVEPYIAQNTPQQAETPKFWPDEAFEKQFANLSPKVADGDRTAADLIAWFEKKASLTQGQKARINSIGAEPIEPPAMDEPPLPDAEDVFAD